MRTDLKACIDLLRGCKVHAARLLFLRPPADGSRGASGKESPQPRLLVAMAPPTTDAFSRDAKMTVDLPRGGAHLAVYLSPRHRPTSPHRRVRVILLEVKGHPYPRVTPFRLAPRGRRNLPSKWAVRVEFPSLVSPTSAVLPHEMPFKMAREHAKRMAERSGEQRELTRQLGTSLDHLLEWRRQSPASSSSSFSSSQEVRRSRWVSTTGRSPTICRLPPASPACFVPSTSAENRQRECVDDD